jgi:hypothetical protein
MTTLDIEIAMMQYIGVRQNVIVNGISWGIDVGTKLMHECDLLSLTKYNYASEIEIKISRADLLKDKSKKHNHDHSHIKHLWFAVPKKLKEIALQEIPERAGLYLLHKWEDGRITVHLEKYAIPRKDAVKWSDKERNDLMRLGTMRIITLKKQVQRALRS